MSFVEAFDSVKYVNRLVSIISTQMFCIFYKSFLFFFYRILEKVNGSTPLDHVFKSLSITSTPILTKSVDSDYSKFCLVR